MKNLDLYERVRNVPNEAKKTITAGRMKGFTDINPMWRIKKLTEEFGVCGIGWYFKVINHWTEKSGDEVAVFAEIELYIKVDGEWSMPIYGIGGNKFAAKEKSGLFVSDECYKMATTDALSVACKHLGIGADVYFEKDTSKYTIDLPEMASEHDVNNVKREIERTGIDSRRVLGTYGVKTVEELTKDNVKDALGKLKKLQDKPVPCIEEPKEPEEEPNLPFR